MTAKYTRLAFPSSAATWAAMRSFDALGYQCGYPSLGLEHTLIVVTERKVLDVGRAHGMLWHHDFE